MCHRASFQDPPTAREVRLNELTDQSGLAYAWLAYKAYDLAAACAGTLNGFSQPFDLLHASYKRCESPIDDGLQFRARRSSAEQLVGLDWYRQPFHAHRSKWLRCHVSLYEQKRLRG